MLTGSITWTDEAYRIYGVSPETFTPTIESLVNLVHPEDRPAMQRWIEACGAGEKPGDLEFRALLPDGTIRLLSGRGELMYDAGNRPAHMAGTVQDITERKQAEETLRESEERFSKAFHSNPAMLVLTTLDGKNVDVNFVLSMDVLSLGGVPHRLTTLLDITARKQAEQALRESDARLRLAVGASNIGLWDWNLLTNEVYFSREWKSQLGCTEDDIPNRFEEWERRLHPDDLAPTLAKVRRFIEDPGAEYAIEFRLRHKDGSYRWIFTEAKFFRDATDRPVRMVGCHIDVTERKRAAEALAKSEARFRMLVNALSEGMGVQDENGLISFMNPRGCELLGYELEELIGKPVSFLFDEDNQAILREQMARRRAGLSQSYEITWRRKDGGTLDTIISPCPLFDENGRFAGSVTVFTDITERKQAEVERETLQKQFQQAQRMESVGRLAGGVAHDFNNMLTVILGHVELALTSVDPSEPLHADLEEIRKAAYRSADLTRQLLAFARRQTIAPRVLDLNEAVGGMIAMLRRLIGEDIELSWRVFSPGHPRRSRGKTWVGGAPQGRKASGLPAGARAYRW